MVKPSSEEYAVLEWVEADFKKLQAMWNDALSDAAERFNAEGMKNDGQPAEVSE